MNILVEGENCELYYAKVHESYRNGLKMMHNTRFFGKGYNLYDEKINTFPEICELCFGAEEIDLLLLTDCWDPDNYSAGLSYGEIDRINCKKAIILCDFWREAERNFGEYEQFVLDLGIDYIFSFFRAPFERWKTSRIYSKLFWFPPSIDPVYFNDWKCDKIWDVGNLNAEINISDGFYPERYAVHQVLKQMEGIRYYTEKHPGSGFKDKEADLVGRKFSMAINKCKIFFTSGNLAYCNFTPKYVEILASRSCLFAYEPMDAELIGLKDGINYVKVSEADIEEKVRYYLNHEDARIKIADNGYKFAMEKYSCYKNALRLNELFF